MCSEVWLNVIFYSSIVGFVLSTVLNVVLIWFLSKTSRKRFGNYKYLMMAFAVVGVFYSLCNFLSRPNVLITDSSFYVFTALKLGFNKSTGTIAVTIYCSCYATMLSLLIIQFYYRYTSVTSPLRLVIFGKQNFHKWGSIVLVYSFVWAATCYFLCGPNELKSQEIEEVILKTYCLAPGEYAYVGSQYFYLNQTTDSITWHLPSVIGMSTFSLLMLFTFLMVLFFGIRTYQTLTESGLTCFASKDLQKQFFRTLVCQTLIPFFFMYLPVTCLFLFPITGLKLHGMENWIPVLVAIYPCLEPMVALYCIQDFRNKIYKFLTCNKPSNKIWSMQIPMSVSDN